MAEPTKDFKVAWTKLVATFEAAPGPSRLATGSDMDRRVQALPFWSDSSLGFFGDGYDSWEGLRRRVREARSSALIDQNAGRGAQSPTIEGAKAGAAEFNAQASRLAQQTADVANATGRAIRNVANGAEKATASPAFVPGVVLVVLLIGGAIVAWKVA